MDLILQCKLVKSEHCLTWRHWTLTFHEFTPKEKIHNQSEDIQLQDRTLLSSKNHFCYSNFSFNAIRSYTNHSNHLSTQHKINLKFPAILETLASCKLQAENRV